MDMIEIIPPASVSGHVVIPGSKSITNRALILAALNPATTRLTGTLWSEDTQIMVECLTQVGIRIEVEPDPVEPCNRTLTVHGGPISSEAHNLYVGNAGTAARFLMSFLCLGRGTYQLHGTPRMHQRPQRALIEALTGLGYRIDHTDWRLPVTIYGAGFKPGTPKVSIHESSQFASALILCGWNPVLTGANQEEAQYVRMTREMIANSPVQTIEPDASSGSYFAAINYLFGGGLTYSWPTTDWQVDSRFLMHLPPRGMVSRETDLGDSIMTAVVVAALGQERVIFRDLGRLRLQECERVRALKTELSKCGAIVAEVGESLLVSPSSNLLHGAEIETYNDHRMAMCFAVVGTRIPEIRIKDPGCVGKTFPNFWDKLEQIGCRLKPSK